MSAPNDLIDCGMCGHAFTREEAEACHGGCPMSSGCGLVTCPSCGYEFPPESKLVTLVTNLFRKKRGRAPSGSEAP